MNKNSTLSPGAGSIEPFASQRRMMKPLAKSAPTVRLLIAEDYQISRTALRALLESEPDFSVVGEASDGAEVVALVSRLRPDILLLGLSEPKMRALDAIRELRAFQSPCRIVVLAPAIEKSRIIEALRLGARGVILKDSATPLLFKCVRQVMAGEYWVGRESVADLVQYLRRAPSSKARTAKNKFGLTSRELQIVDWVMAGHSNKNIAKRCAISVDTVKHHLSSTFTKLGVSNRLELVLFAIDHRLIAD